MHNDSTTHSALIAWIPLLPLLGFLVNGLWYALFQTKRGSKKASSAVTGVIATLAIGGAFAVSVMLFLTLKAMPEEQRALQQNLFTWMRVGTLQVDMAFTLDTLSTLFTLVITGVGTLIHIYSIGYMSHDATPGKFFAYLNLFCFAMLMLVLGSSLPILFLGWEGVGLCSYLLIGYWYTDMDKASAGKKAFIVNRIGDLGFLLGMFMIYTVFNTLDFSGIQAGMPAAVSNPGALTLIALLLFVGCMGKSAQIPLFVWLPDAMAGPTPVSALIHAATMVTSGIYMIARLNFIYSASPSALHVVAVVGALTAFFAATIAVVQTDIKKILAYSTVSQLGYMFLGCGVGAYSAGVFHVITHAFFKALLFLGAGSVIHGMHEEQNILKMGGLKSKMPVTFAVFGIGWLAICGIPPFSGFFSKDEILWQAYASAHGSPLLYGLAALTAAMTAFYMTRLFSLTFLGKPRFAEQPSYSNVHAIAKHGIDDHGHGDHGSESKKGVHESPAVMTGPLIALAILSAVGGLIGIPHASWLDEWLKPVIHTGHVLREGVAPTTEWVLMGVSVTLAAVAIAFAMGLYRDLKRAESLALKHPALHKLLVNKWYVDELYEALFVKPIYALSVGLWNGFDIAVIDRVVNGFGRVSLWTGQAARMAQTGSIQMYAFMILAGLVASVGYLIYGLV